MKLKCRDETSAVAAATGEKARRRWHHRQSAAFDALLDLLERGPAKINEEFRDWQERRQMGQERQ